MDVVTRVKLINIAAVILVGIFCAVFFAYNPARKRKDMAIAIRYFSLFFFLMAVSYTLIVIRGRGLMSVSLNVSLTNLCEILAFLSLRFGFTWRRGVKQNLHQAPWVYGVVMIWLIVQVGVLHLWFDLYAVRAITSAAIYGIILLSCLPLLPLADGAINYGERIAKNGLAVSVVIMQCIYLFQQMAIGESDMLAFIMLGQLLIALTLFGSIMSLMMNDLVEEQRMDAITDPLTGLFNRRHFMASAIAMIKSGDRTQQPIALVMSDIDHFKKINDNFGHDVGDKAICEFSQVLLSLVRESDMLARFGGEEFIMMLPHTSLEGATTLAERMRAATEGMEIVVPGGKVEFTASFGVTTIEGLCSINDKIREADRALYAAKFSGRNRVCTYDGSRDLEPGLGQSSPVN